MSILETNFIETGTGEALNLGHPQCSYVPTADADVANKAYVDNEVLTGLTFISPMNIVGNTVSMYVAGPATSGYVTAGDQTLAGTKIFVNPPTVPLTPVADPEMASKGYVDSQAVTALLFDAPLAKDIAGHVTLAAAGTGADGYLTSGPGSQDIDGIKTFASLPSIPLAPFANTDMASKSYVDSLVAAVPVGAFNSYNGFVGGAYNNPIVLNVYKVGRLVTCSWLTNGAASTVSQILFCATLPIDLAPARTFHRPMIVMDAGVNVEGFVKMEAGSPVLRWYAGYSGTGAFAFPGMCGFLAGTVTWFTVIYYTSPVKKIICRGVIGYYRYDL